MKRLFGLTAGLMMLGSVALAGCGGNKCDDLKDTCAKCKSTVLKASCNAVVTQDNSDACDAAQSSSVYATCK